MNDLVAQVYRGKTLGRILFNRAVKENSSLVNGKVLDLASGMSPSYAEHLPKSINRITADKAVDGIDMDNSLPFDDGKFNAVLFFNAVYIAKRPEFILSEIGRILAPGGVLLLSSPFIQAEIPEPHDYLRFTNEGLARVINETGFEKVSIERLGGRFAAAANLLHDYFIFDTIRLITYTLALLLDRLTRHFQQLHPAPILYFVTARKHA